MAMLSPIPGPVVRTILAVYSSPWPQAELRSAVPCSLVIIQTATGLQFASVGCGRLMHSTLASWSRGILEMVWFCQKFLESLALVDVVHYATMSDFALAHDLQLPLVLVSSEVYFECIVRPVMALLHAEA
eukprot:5630142-Amphidinium_carterae.1